VPPRYAYWTIIVDDQPTAFRSASREEILPTFNRLKAKQPSAVLKWFQNGKLWESDVEAREAQIRRGEEGRRHDKNQQSDRPPRQLSGKLDWKPKGTGFSQRPPKREWPARQGSERPQAERRERAPFKGGPKPEDRKSWSPKPKDTSDRPKLEWSPRGASTGSRPERRERPPFKSHTNSRDAKPWGTKPAAKPWGTKPGAKSWGAKSEAKPWGAKPWSGKPKESRDRPPYKGVKGGSSFKGGSNRRDTTPHAAKPRDEREGQKLEWTPRQAPAKDRAEKRPRPPYKGETDQREVKRDAKWRPGGDHRDPRQKYKDAKKAKWTRFKAAIRKRRPPRKP
jgi:hypothetical protein